LNGAVTKYIAIAAITCGMMIGSSMNESSSFFARKSLRTNAYAAKKPRTVAITHAIEAIRRLDHSAFCQRGSPKNAANHLSEYAGGGKRR
jgi:hypothetical protein